jgi:hypothetical protein
MTDYRMDKFLIITRTHLSGLTMVSRYSDRQVATICHRCRGPRLLLPCTVCTRQASVSVQSATLLGFHPNLDA